MRFRPVLAITGTLAALALVSGCAQTGSMSAGAAHAGMGFFVTSANPGKGADFGGLAGADAYCTKLAASAGAGGKTWRAYLSATGANAVNARDRIGSGPWITPKASW